jgi:tRNA threonylcarbamoyladenosine biosynthesis protein TsaE
LIEIATSNPAETLALGRRLAAMLSAGDVVLLAGQLGAGKTMFAAGIGEGLGVEEPLTSPSFILARAHQGFMPLVHADVYRRGTSA